MAKSKFNPSLGETFSIGKLVGQKEAFEEILEMVTGELSIATLRIYLNARLKTINSSMIDDPFKQKGSK